MVEPGDRVTVNEYGHLVMQFGCDSCLKNIGSQITIVIPVKTGIQVIHGKAASGLHSRK